MNADLTRPAEGWLEIDETRLGQPLLVDGEPPRAIWVIAAGSVTLRDRAGRDITVQVDPAIYPLRPVMILAPTTARIAALY